MTDAALQQYTALLMELLTKRDAAGGAALSQAEESNYASLLDYYWSAMTLDEQDAAKRRFLCEA